MFGQAIDRMGSRCFVGRSHRIADDPDDSVTRCAAGDKARERGIDPVGVLSGDEAKAEFGRSFVGDDGFGAMAGVA